MLKRMPLPLLTAALVLSACGTFNVSVEQEVAPPGSTPNPTQTTLAIEATSMSSFITQQAATLFALTPTLTPNPPYDPARPWKTYQDNTFGFVMEYPAIYDEPPYTEACGLKPSNQGVRLGRQTEILFLPAQNLTLEEFAGSLVSEKGWSVESQEQTTVSGLPALTVEYRFGGTSRFGTFTLVDFQGLIFAFGFSAGDFCDIPGNVTEAEAYSHLIETFHILGVQPSPTPTAPAPQVAPILVYPPNDSESGLLLGGVRQGSWVDAGTTAGLLTGDETYAIYREGRLLTSLQGSRPRQDSASCPEKREVSLQADRPFRSIIGLSAEWNALPRSPVEISPDNAIYRQAVSELVRANGIREPDLGLSGVLKIDLDGDGTDEILISAARFADGSGRDATAGDYSVILLRKVNGNGVTSIPVAADYYAQSQASAFPSEYLLTGVLDLNGDGRMEIVVSISGLKKTGALAYEIDGRRVREVLAVRCP